MKLPKKFQKPVQPSLFDQPAKQATVIDDDPAPKKPVLAPIRLKHVSIPYNVKKPRPYRFPRYRQGEFLLACCYAYYVSVGQAIISDEEYDDLKASYLFAKTYEKKGEQRGRLLLGPPMYRVCDYLPRERYLALYFLFAYPADRNYARQVRKREDEEIRKRVAERQNLSGVKPSPPDNWDE